MPPGTLVAYEVALERVVDLSKGYQQGEWETLWEDWACDFRKLVLENTEPPSWLMGDLALEQGASGLLFPSLRRKDGLNLVVYTSQLGPKDALKHFDPRGDLEIDVSAWLKG